MHAILTLTMMHDRHAVPGLRVKPSTSEVYHSSRAMAGLNAQLSGQLVVQEQAALWATSAIISIIVFCSIDATIPEEAWPLASPSPSDLVWLKMCDGKREVFKHTKSLQHDPVFDELVILHRLEAMPVHSNQLPLTNLPFLFHQVFDLASPTSPYSSGVFQLAEVSDPACSPMEIILAFWTFTGSMNPGSRALLRQKDPRSLLLLVCWYAKLIKLGVWWFTHRIRVEGRAICIFLQRYHVDDVDLQTLLDIPRQVLLR